MAYSVDPEDLSFSGVPPPPPPTGVQPMLARRLMRLAVLQAVTAANPGAWTIESPGDWPTPPEKCPVVLIRTPGDGKSEWHRGQSTFTTNVNIQILGRVIHDNEQGAQDAIEAMGYTLEEAVLSDYWLRRVISSFTTVTTEQHVTSEGDRHIGAVMINLGIETAEAFFAALTPPPLTQWPPPEPAAPVPLEEIKIDVDTIRPYDPTGPYPFPDFPDAPVGAPRDHGPDGRLEGTIVIDLPQD